MKVTKLILVAALLFGTQSAHAALGEIPSGEVQPGMIYCAEKQKKIDLNAAAKSADSAVGNAGKNEAAW